MVRPPAPRPCGSCPYRCDVPSGVWDASEYAKLPAYDEATFAQPAALFLCHQQDGRVCAGWAAVHDMDECLALRLAAANDLSREDCETIRDYSTDVPVFASGAEVAAHGLALVEEPPAEAARMIAKLARRRS